MHGIRRVRVPWAVPASRFTIAFERHAIDVLLEADVQGGQPAPQYLSGLFLEENLPEPSRERFASLRCAASEDRPSLGDQGIAAGVVELSSSRLGKALLAAVVLLGDPSRLKPVNKVARTIHRHLENVMTYFDHRITNAISEGLNSKIQTLKKTPTGIAIGTI